MDAETENPAGGQAEPGCTKTNNCSYFSGAGVENQGFSDIVTTYNGTTPYPTGETTWQAATEAISSDRNPFKALIEEIRQEPDRDRRNALKCKLSAVTYSGTFTYRKNLGVSIPTGFIIPDLDHIKDVPGLMELLQRDPLIWFCFVSPSGDGIKAAIRAHGIKSDAEHKVLFAAVEHYFNDTYGIRIDPACKDISRLTFTSYDPGAWVNPDPVFFDVDAWTPQTAKKANPLPRYDHNDRGADNRTKYGRKVLESSCERISQSLPTQQHGTRLRAGRLVGGFIASGFIDESEALPALENAASASGAKDMRSAMQTIRDGIEYGKTEPLYPDNWIERDTHQRTSTGAAETVSDDWTPEISSWPELDPIAFRGIAGDFVALATRKSEADPAAVLITFLVRMGVEIGRKPFVQIGDTAHFLNLMAVIVGDTSKARKGTSAAPIETLFSYLIRTFCNTQHTENKVNSYNSFNSYIAAKKTPGPLSTGEGLIWAVRDPIEAFVVDKKTGQGEMQTIDPGINDKRLFVMDAEFASALKCTKREGNTLATAVRCLWDDGNAAPLTKTSRGTTTGAHIGVVTHITREELHKTLAEVEAFSGFANRFLWICARRQCFEPFPEPMPEEELHDIAKAAINVFQFYTKETEIKLSEAARQFWAEIYINLSTGYPGFAGGVLNRAEAQVTRLALLYACLDKSWTIEPVHIQTALALWKYTEQSAFYIFGNVIDPTEQHILDTLKTGPKTATEIYKSFSNNITKSKLQSAINNLISTKKAFFKDVPTGGRPKTIFYINEKNELKEKSNKSNSYETQKARKKYEERSGNDENNVSDEFADVSSCEDTVIF